MLLSCELTENINSKIDDRSIKFQQKKLKIENSTQEIVSFDREKYEKRDSKNSLHEVLQYHEISVVLPLPESMTLGNDEP